MGQQDSTCTAPHHDAEGGAHVIRAGSFPGRSRSPSRSRGGGLRPGWFLRRRRRRLRLRLLRGRRRGSLLRRRLLRLLRRLRRRLSVRHEGARARLRPQPPQGTRARLRGPQPPQPAQAPDDPPPSPGRQPPQRRRRAHLHVEEATQRSAGPNWVEATTW
jgi:hypothetical protein